MIQKKDILLASGSPRRKELLTQAGLRFRVLTADTDETPGETEPAKVVEELSGRKAEAVWKLLAEQEGSGTEEVVVAADTIVAYDGEILGKPKDEADAFRMLRELSGGSHEVHTGVTILIPGEKDGDEAAAGVRRLTFFVCTKVHFYPLSDEEIREYISTGEPMDKAGAYGIQGLGARLVERIEGDYNNVVGFPLAAFLRKALEAGILAWT